MVTLQVIQVQDVLACPAASVGPRHAPAAPTPAAVPGMQGHMIAKETYTYTTIRSSPNQKAKQGFRCRGQ